METFFARPDIKQLRAVQNASHPESHVYPLVTAEIQRLAAQVNALKFCWPGNELATQLAKAFSLALREHLTEEELDLAIIRNAAETEPAICHTHDFGDPNMAMVHAFNGLMRFPLVTTMCDHMELINQAWAIAKANNFSYEHI